MKRTLQDAARALGGQLVGDDRPFGAVSRTAARCKPGALFVALRGPNFDGADFVAAACRAAPSAPSSSARLPHALPQMAVPDTLRALQPLARAGARIHHAPGGRRREQRQDHGQGNDGRHSVAHGPCLATHGNLNNHIGVPVTLMRLEPSHRSAVIEMGANRIGDVAELMRSRAPRWGSSPTPARSIWRDSATLTAWRRAKARRCPASGPRPQSSMPTTPTQAIGEASHRRAHRHLRRARRRGFHGEGHPAVDRARTLRHALHAGMPARSARRRACKTAARTTSATRSAAAAAAAAAGASLEDIAAGLADFRAVAGRLQLKAGPRDSWIIDDSYNANPSSVRAGLDVLRSLPGRPGWCSATWPSSAIIPKTATRTGPLCARLRGRAAVRAGPAEHARRRDLRLGRGVVRGRRFPDPPVAGGARARA